MITTYAYISLSIRSRRRQLHLKQIQKSYGIQGISTVLVWLRKYGTLDLSNPNLRQMQKSKETPAQKIKRLERQLED
jgi:hypothetical protein